MSNNNRRQPQHNYQQHRQHRPAHPRGNQHPQHPPYFTNQQYPPPQYYPQYYPQNFKDDAMRHQYNQQPPHTPYFYPPYPHYPMPYPNYQQPFPYPQHPQNQTQSANDKKNYEQQRNSELKQERNQEQKERLYEPKQERTYEPKRNYESRNNNRNYEARNDRSEQRQSKPYPRIERSTPNQQEQARNRDESEQIFDEENESESESQSEEVIYRRKVITKRKDPVLDSKQEIRKWIEARKHNYPKRSIRPEQAQGKMEQSEMSILEKKIRKKILLINADPRSMMKKLKDIDILRRFILYSRKPRKNVPLPQRTHQPAQQQLEQPKQQQQQQQQPNIAAQPQIDAVAQMQPQQPFPNKQQMEQREEAVEQPIKSGEMRVEGVREREREFVRREELSVDVIIKHLQMKQSQDTKTLQSLMDYKSNSFHFRYQHQTLQTNLLLDNIFNETSYILQAIRYIVKNNFFQTNTPPPQP